MNFKSVVLFLLLSLSAMASDYPPDYAHTRDCQIHPSNPNIAVCVINYRFPYPRLEIIYAGELIKQYHGKINTWVKLNGRSDTFAMKNSNYRERVILNQTRSYQCVALPEGCVQPEPVRLPNCRYAFTKEGETPYRKWEVEPAPQKERDLFFYAYNQYGRPNHWDIEVAFVGPNGQWDSNFGQNYRFLFR